MSWTNEETNKFQLDNKEYLAEINASLRPDRKPITGKIGIFCPGQNGDLMTAMSVLKYRNELWPDKEIIWFCNMPNADALRYAPINEVRPWPWSGNGLPEGTPDFYPLLCDENNKLNKELAKQYELTADLDDGYFPAPHQLSVDKRHGIDYPNCSRKVFGISPSLEWHPLLSFHGEEIDKAIYFNRDKLSYDIPIKTIMLETVCGSGQSIWDDEMTINTMEICRQQFKYCNFLFASHKGTDQFKNEYGYYSLANFTPRQVARFIFHCDLFIGISSGISVATSYWGSKPVPKIQFCGSRTCSTVALATGEIYLVTHDEKTPQYAKNEFYDALKQILKTI